MADRIYRLAKLIYVILESINAMTYTYNVGEWKLRTEKL